MTRGARDSRAQSRGPGLGRSHAFRTKDVRRLVVDRRREHSRKPDQVRERIEGPYLEMFARETKRGWECWGNQPGLFDNGFVETRRQPSFGSTSTMRTVQAFTWARLTAEVTDHVSAFRTVAGWRRATVRA
jgi:hypothetical protein